MKKLAFIAILLFFSLNLTSCINIVRNIKVNKDGSGSENTIIDFDKTFFDVMVAFATISDSSNADAVRDSLYNDIDFISGIKGKLSGAPGITLDEIYSVTNPDSSKTLYASYNFDKVTNLGISISEESSHIMSNNVIIEYKDEGETIKFSYTELKPSNEENTNDTSYNNLIEGIAELFKGKQAVYNFEFDYDVVSSNATSTDGRKLTWIVPLDEKMTHRDGVYLEAILRK
jgi:hypothetical protein